MIGIDTNILLRVFIDDDPAQTSAARALVGEAKPGQLLVSIIVLVEFVWTLRSGYKVEKPDILDALHKLLSGAAFEIEDRDEVEHATMAYAAAKIDLADCLISLRNKRLGASHTLSFDMTSIKNDLFVPLPT